MSQLTSRSEMGREWAATPSPRQLHGLAGDLIIAARLYGSGLRRRLNARTGFEYYKMTPDSYMACETDENSQLAFEVHESISAQLGLIGHQCWSLAMSELSARRSVQVAPRSVDIGQIAHLDTMRVTGIFDIDPGVHEFGIRTDYLFRWDRNGVTDAWRNTRAVPHQFDVEGVPLLRSLPDESGGNTEAYNAAVSTALTELWCHIDMERVSSPDVTYLRQRIAQHCGKLVSAWDGVLND